MNLTHYQKTNFRLFQNKKVCRRQFQIWQKWQKVIYTGRKHWKKEKLLICPQCFQKACFPGASKGVIMWEWVNQMFSRRIASLSTKWQNCRAVQIDCIFIQQKWYETKTQICSGKSMKCCGKRVEMLVTGIFCFPKYFQKASFSGLFWGGILWLRVESIFLCCNPFLTIPCLKDPEKGAFWKQSGKWRKCYLNSFSPFPQMFLLLHTQTVIIWI